MRTVRAFQRDSIGYLTPFSLPSYLAPVCNHASCHEITRTAATTVDHPPRPTTVPVGGWRAKRKSGLHDIVYSYSYVLHVYLYSYDHRVCWRQVGLKERLTKLKCPGSNVIFRDITQLEDVCRARGGALLTQGQGHKPIVSYVPF